MTNHRNILLFDGVCNLCNRIVRFIIRRDRYSKIRVAPLQSPEGEKALIENALSIENIDSIVYIAEGRYYIKSTAILNLLRDLGGSWSLWYGFIILPRFMRDYLYDITAKYRYRAFGMADKCMLPSADHPAQLNISVIDLLDRKTRS